MSNILKHLSSLSLWIAALMLSAHLLFPHDHHITDSFSSQDKDCPVSNNKSGHKPGFPMHCHAFNVDASEKARLLHITQSIKFSFISIGSFSYLSDSDKQLLSASVIDLQKPIFNSFTLELCLLRAPPVLA